MNSICCATYSVYKPTFKLIRQTFRIQSGKLFTGRDLILMKFRPLVSLVWVLLSFKRLDWHTVTEFLDTLNKRRQGKFTGMSKSVRETGRKKPCEDRDCKWLIVFSWSKEWIFHEGWINNVGCFCWWHISLDCQIERLSCYFFFHFFSNQT